MIDCCTPSENKAQSKNHTDIPERFLNSPKGWLTAWLIETDALLIENAKLRRKVKRLEKKGTHA